MRRKIILILLISLFPAAFLNAADKRELPLDNYSDIFLTTVRADIVIIPAGKNPPEIKWRSKYCRLEVKEAADNVLQINVTPKPQHVFLKEILGIEQYRCRITLELPEDKNIYASSTQGSIKLQNIKAKSARLYTAEGNIDIDDYHGSLTAETLTGRIAARALNCPAADFKSASGNIFAVGAMKHVNMLNTSGASRLHGIMEVLRFYSSEGDLLAVWEELPQNPLEISARSFAGNLEIILPPKTDPSDKKNNIHLKTFYGKALVSARAS